jgi:hypothetical protein
MSDRKPIPDWPEYEIDTNGNVYRVAANTGTRPGRKLKATPMSHGYMRVSLSRNAKARQFTVHRLVAKTFLGPVPDGLDVCHIDGDRGNNALTNLRIDTRAGNMADTLRHGTTNRGERCGSNKHSRETILAMRARISAGEKVPALSLETGIPKTTLYGIKYGSNWKWL